MTGDTYVGAIDQGTTGTRFLVIDGDRRVVASAYETHEQHYPRPGWVEHDPDELRENTRTVVTRALDEGDIDPEQLAAIGIANQRETTLLWERATGEPVAEAIVWQDRRTTDRIEKLNDGGLDDSIRAKTGLEPDAYFSATKLEWLLDNPGSATHRENAGDLRERAENGDLRFGTVDAWLIDDLTDTHVTDVTNAARTMLYDIHEGGWDSDLLDEFGVPEAVLPAVRPSSDSRSYGTTDPGGFLGAEIPVTAALGDQQAALLGHACIEAGDAKSTYGTGAFVLQHTGTEAVASDHGLLTTIAFQRDDGPVQYALEGSIFTTGAAVEWLGDLGLIDSPEETARLARSVDSTDGVYLVPAFSGLGAPHWDGRARGTIVGLTRGTRREHLARATLEAIAFRTRDVAEAMVADSGRGVERLHVDGGAAENDVLCELQANLTDMEIARPAVSETTALGAAFAAGLAVDYWNSLDELRENRRVDATFAPEDTEDRDERYARWQDAIERSRDWSRDGD